MNSLKDKLVVYEFDCYWHEIPETENPGLKSGNKCVMITKAYDYDEANFVVLRIYPTKYESVHRIGKFNSIEEARDFANKEAITYGYHLHPN